MRFGPSRTLPTAISRPVDSVFQALLAILPPDAVPNRPPTSTFPVTFPLAQLPLTVLTMGLPLRSRSFALSPFNPPTLALPVTLAVVCEPVTVPWFSPIRPPTESRPVTDPEDDESCTVPGPPLT